MVNRIFEVEERTTRRVRIDEKFFEQLKKQYPHYSDEEIVQTAVENGWITEDDTHWMNCGEPEVVEVAADIWNWED